ncbi:ABC transporter permease subunit [Thermodesulforhabdus norvegica]|uniref:ABC-2 type transport system permease protein n=1 Tax=Thermodesulforhabdus norvegica TaxID=39841 RepID=A0A1I4UWF6_9BACT|nr:ABC transporter permease subunit [Thermodesulforhabdus norvegica]SFM93120.1 ABC-2 type transport system permease protein [Thermodesulforhabdus norvegica]
MKGFWAVYRKELYSFMFSPIIYVVAVVFFLLAGYFFYSGMAYYSLVSFQASQNPFMARELNITNMVTRPFFLDLSIVFLLLSPLLTMRLFAEERKSGTLELLLTYPISDAATVWAKFCAVLTVYLILLLGTLPCMLILDYLTDPNWLVILGGYGGLILMGAAFLSLGIFTSSLTQNQIIAATISFGALLGFWIISWMRSIAQSTFVRNLFEYLSITEHLDPFTKGLIDTRHIVYYVLFTVVFLFLTRRRIDSYRWNG